MGGLNTSLGLLGKLAKNKVVQAGVALGALTGVSQDASAEVHKNVTLILGNSSSFIRAHSVSVDYNAANPQASMFTAKEIVAEVVTQDSAGKMGLDHMAIDGNILMHAEDSGLNKKAAINVYWNGGNGKMQTVATLKLNATNVDEFDATDEFFLSEGVTSDKNQIIATNLTVVKTYVPTKDANGKIVGLKLLAKIDLPADIGEQKKVYKDILVTTSDSNSNVFLFQKNPDGTWSQKAKKDFSPDAIAGWSGSDRPIFITPSGVNILLVTGMKNEVVDANLNLVEKVNGNITSFGENGKYKTYFDTVSLKSYVINSKGEKIEMGNNIILPTNGEYVEIDKDKNPEVFVAGNTIVRVISESPLKVEAFVFDQSAVVAPYQSFIEFPCTDPDKDLTYCLDNCPTVANPDQADDDKDGLGNACDPDFVVKVDPGPEPSPEPNPEPASDLGGGEPNAPDTVDGVADVPDTSGGSDGVDDLNSDASIPGDTQPVLVDGSDASDVNDVSTPPLDVTVADLASGETTPPMDVVLDDASGDDGMSVQPEVKPSDTMTMVDDGASPDVLPTDTALPLDLAQPGPDNQQQGADTSAGKPETADAGTTPGPDTQQGSDGVAGKDTSGTVTPPSTTPHAPADGCSATPGSSNKLSAMEIFLMTSLAAGVIMGTRRAPTPVRVRRREDERIEEEVS